MHKIINADIFVGLKSLDNKSIDVAITSPPYWAQRNYGFDKQIGNESTYIEFISRLTFLFGILKDKMTAKGVFFLNIGDKYLKKYGKTPLGLIPYKLSYFMQQNGWFLNDTIIWFKPNHMPSSVKNRFVNSYEPIFVFSKNRDNYFNDFRKDQSDFHNIIDINLQPTPYKHVAVYPEKLVSKLLSFVKIEKNYSILDPFAGSGTTLKVINDFEPIWSEYHIKGIMIEFNSDYVDIIKKRTGLSEIEVIKIPYRDYNFPILKEEPSVSLNDFENYNEIKTLNLVDDKNNFYRILKTIQSKYFLQKFPENKIIFVGLKNFDIEDIYNISFIKKWIIRNKIVVRNQRWYPIFMLVPDNKTHKYIFNYFRLHLNHKNENHKIYPKSKFLEYKVVDNFFKGKNRGIIYKILSFYENNFPKYVLVLWENGIVTREFIIQNQEEIQSNLIKYKLNGYTSVKEIKEIIPIEKKVRIEKNLSMEKYFNGKGNLRTYNGKFREIERKNRGASPGARSSVEEECFSVKRLYEAEQDLIADYLNYIRIKNNYSKKKFTELFPKEYKHTVGHWLRKDFGGSIPVPEDWELLEKYFPIDPEIKKYICSTALKLQTVTATKFKIPEDVVNYELLNKFEKLNM